MNQSSPLAATTLKVVGVILIVSSIIDYMILAYPADLLNRQWQIGYVSQIVDRGIIPLVGLTFLFTGYAIESMAGLAKPPRNAFADIRFWGILLSTILGVIYLLLCPLHIQNVLADQKETQAQISQQANQAEAQLKNQLSSDNFKSEVEKRQKDIKTQLSELLGNQEKLNQALQSEAVPDNEKKLLEQFKSNPTEVDKFVKDQFNPDTLRDRELIKIRTRQQELEKQTKDKAFRLSTQTGTQSFLLAVAYSTIAGIGIKNLGYLRGGRSRSGR